MITNLNLKELNLIKSSTCDTLHVTIQKFEFYFILFHFIFILFFSGHVLT